MAGHEWGRGRMEEEVEPMWSDGAAEHAAPTWHSLLQAAPALAAPTWRGLLQASPVPAAHGLVEEQAEPGSGGSACAELGWEECGPSCWWCVETAACVAHPGECFAAAVHPANASTPRAGGWAMLLVFAAIMLSCAAIIWLTRGRQREPATSRAYGELSSGFDRQRAPGSSRDEAWSGAGAASGSTPGQPEGQRLLDALA